MLKEDRVKRGEEENMASGITVTPSDGACYPIGFTKKDGAAYVSAVSSAESLMLVLYEQGKDEPLKKIPFPESGRMGDVWGMKIEGMDFRGVVYCLEADGILCSDPYGKAFTGREAWGDLTQAGVVLKSPADEEVFDWEGDEPLGIPYEDMVMYRIHVRGFTRHPSSKVKEKGTFCGIIGKIPYLKKLGITTLEIMPVNEFDEVIMPPDIAGNPFGQAGPTGKLNYWGYAPAFYFAVKESFSSGTCGSPSQEFKLLVKELHRAGIEVIPELYFSGKESPAFVLDAVRYWIREFHVDGIHLVGFAPTGLLGADPYLSRTKLLATSWDGVPGGKHKHLGEYNDGFLVDMRRLLKGDEDQMNNLIFRSKRNPKDYGLINYIAHTNGFTLMDMVSYDMKHNEENGENNQDGNSYNYSWNCGVEGPTRRKKVVELRKKQIRNAILLVMLSQGVPLLLAGDEFGHSKGGNNNSYCQDNEISWLNWNQQRTNKDLWQFVRHAIEFRKKHPVFHMSREPMVMDYLSCGHPDVSYHGVKAWCPEFENFRRQLGIMYCGQYAEKPDGGPDDYFFVAYNMHWEPHEFALPNLPKKMKWHLAINTDAKEINGIYEEGSEPEAQDQKQFIVPPRSIVVFIGK